MLIRFETGSSFLSYWGNTGEAGPIDANCVNKLWMRC